jgi:predicted dehydrogenase
MYLGVFKEHFPDTTKLLAICDKNQGRVNNVLESMKNRCSNLKGYTANDFDKMLKEHKPDCVIVCTQDSFHDDYVCRSLEAGCDVVVEKPMTTDEKKCQRIVDTIKKTGKSVRVTFNYRYSPPRTQIKELLMSGIIGKVLSLDFQWMLDTNHGADYFRRWHRYKKNSGGLMVHKATHHFDLINWWLSSIPVSVFAEGDRVFYNSRQAKCHGLENHAERCRDCSLSGKCNYYLNMGSFDVMKELYSDNEKYDGYFRDKCVFGNDIDIEDTMNVVVRYKSGAILSYALNAFCPWEGYRVAFNGTKGRLEQDCHESSYLNGDGTVAGSFQSEGSSIKVFPSFKTPYEIKMYDAKGSHGGGDIVMLNDIFDTPEDDPCMRSADYVQGAYSMLVGVAANKSMATGKKIYIADLVSGLDAPAFPAMPDGSENIPFVEKACRMAGGEKALANIPIKI